MILFPSLRISTPSTRIERHADHWCVWTAHNPDYTLGTMMLLYDNGRCERVTLREGEADDVFVVYEGGK